MIQTNRKKILLKVSVMLDTGDGEQFAHMFVPPTLEVGDVLNDERAFLPVERVDGTAAMIAKTSIRSVASMESSYPIETTDPYDLLGIDPAASDTEVQAAYHRAVGAVHPDRIQSLGLPPEFMELATRRAAKLNDAYRKIRAERKTGMQPA